MSWWKSLLIWPYLCGTWPIRSWRNRAAVQAGRAPILVFYYHRIADDAANDWTVSNALFRQQVSWLRRHFRMISLSECQRRMSSNQNTEPCAAITFDDGYAENCEQAIPWLVKERIPCTYFVATDFVIHEKPFPHDVLMGNRFATNSLTQLREMAAAGIEIGAHTRSHADCGKIADLATLQHEIAGSGELLEQELGTAVRHFAFPYGMHGNLSNAAVQVAYEAGYESFSSAYGGFNLPGDPLFHIQRIGGEGPLSRLINWATGDPLKQFRHRRFEFELEEVGERVSELVIT
ncbi:MAG: polysaccharide deacetylase family protein [Pirellulales bacterium]|nr:polysaccharide deacetylase family protein [Pirellulales bacterium]